MTPTDFRAWMRRHGLTKPAAAAVLGVGTSSIGLWRSHGTDCRRTELACWAIDHGALDGTPLAEPRGVMPAIDALNLGPPALPTYGREHRCDDDR